ncbi:hypothetical protein JUN65_08005 [Gluconacetobacter azotocaptans]|uniref:XF1762 family protein n=1 Tax=Gluconacetobacter azotocaptans TaxID=142834 RepID=UPI00195D52CC|nr:XF1762 family protein [Gluconacetobacter azotocaptans]MBM9401528.1 hypothetical protein [Gluconacetobacter azotocaptans]
MTIEIVPLTIKAARAFVTAHHRHNKAPQGALFAVGAASETGLVGVATIGRPVSRLMQDGTTAEVTRVCVLDGSPKGTCSALYGAAWRAARALGWRRLITYTLQSESGSSLRGAGWRVLAERAANRADGWQSRPGRDKQCVVAEPKYLWSTP